MTVPTTAEAVRKESDYLVQLDGLRFIAVTLVMIDHWLGELNQLPLGYFGVNLFFVLSGFLITRILIGSKAADLKHGRTHGRSLRQFYIRRSLRIFPVYYITLIVLAIIGFPAVRENLVWLFTYTQNIWVAIHKTWFGAIDHLWSLAVEEQYYLFFPFLVFAVPDRYLLRTLVGLVLLSVGLRLGLYLSGASWMVQFVLMPTCLDAFGLGGLLAYLMVFHRERFVRLAGNPWLLLASLLLYVLDLYLMRTMTPSRNVMTDVFDRLITSVFCFFIIGGAVVGYRGVVRWLLENPVSNFLGRISYGLYLFHNLVFNAYHTPPTYLTLRAFDKATRMLPVLSDNIYIKLAYFYMITVLIATVSWYVIEKPFNALKSRFSY